MVVRIEYVLHCILIIQHASFSSGWCDVSETDKRINRMNNVTSFYLHFIFLLLCKTFSDDQFVFFNSVCIVIGEYTL